ncbi:uncharacterized protein [Pagrus major]|uniref:uncharacterized protein n=1 Tax=Pagrus major TaxID=143350 RepID=UPI003CC8BECC
MHWEDLSQRIAELEKQEQERRERSKGFCINLHDVTSSLWSFIVIQLRHNFIVLVHCQRSHSVESLCSPAEQQTDAVRDELVNSRGTGVRVEESQGGVWRDVWEEEEEDFRRCRVTQRFHNHRNLQLCFINNSDSEDEEEGGSKKVSKGRGGNGCHAAGLKQEVATALRTLRDKLLAEQKEKEHLASSSGVSKRKHLERWELQECSEQQLSSLRASLQQDVHALSSELVAHLLVRDQLRTKQDAMLLDVQDLT